MRGVGRAVPVLVAVLVSAVPTLAGCGTAPPETVGSPPASASASAPSAEKNVTNVMVTVRGGKVSTPRTRVRVERGATVRVTLTSDRAEELHLHGYDRSVAVGPGRRAVLTLVADRTGVFEAELHQARTRVFELQVG